MHGRLPTVFLKHVSFAMLPLLLLVLLAPAAASADDACSTEDLADSLPDSPENFEVDADQYISLLQTSKDKSPQAVFHARVGSEADGHIDKVQVESDAIAVTEKEYRGTAPCSFRDEEGRPALCAAEKPEHRLLSEWLRPNMTVLELGARYGTTTCTIAAKQGNSGKLLAVEPDSSTWGALEDNLRSHQCNTSVLKGVVGTTARDVKKSSYGTTTVALAALSSAPAMPLRNLELTLGLRFDTVMIDCEGCIDEFLSENPDALNNITTLFLEADQGSYVGDVSRKCLQGAKCVDYDAVIHSLRSQGFEILEDAVTLNDVEKPYFNLHHLVLRRRM